MKFLSTLSKSTVLIFMLFASLELQAATSPAPFTFSAYFRGGVGSNLKGGQCEEYKNAGSQGNEFRLGNECHIYSEASFISQLVDPANAKGISAQALFMFSYFYNNTTDNEVQPNSNWVLRQAYIDLAATDDVPGKFWIGKRFYRWSDVHSADFFPVNFSGPGAGWGGFKTRFGTWDVGVIQNSESKEINDPITPVSSRDTEINNASKTTFHLRLEEMPINEQNKLYFWLTFGTTPSTKERSVTPTNYKATSGSFFAAKEVFANDNLNNEFGFAYGNGVLSSMSSLGDLVKDCNTLTDSQCTVKNSSRLRAWESLTIQKDKWSSQFAAIFDQYDKNTSTNSKVTWTSLAIQPIYYFTDNVHLISVLGYSNVKDESDGLGNRTLTRFTVGPQLSIAKGYFTRPVLRFLYSYNSWSRSNKAKFVAPNFSESERDSHNLLAQVEVWF